MPQHLVSEAQVKKALKIDSFRNLSRDKIMEFVSLIPDMDKDVAIAIVNQFPAYAESAISMIAQLRRMCEDILESNDISRTETINAYKKILDDLGEILKRDDITPEERQQITQSMIDIADRISAKDTENKKWLEKIFNCGASFIGGALILGAIILGVNVKGHQIPSLDDENSEDDKDCKDDDSFEL